MIARATASALAIPAALAGAVLFAAVSSAHAQETPDTVAAVVPLADSTAADSASAIGPAGAFLRGSLIPGWGHASTGSLTRGAFYFGTEALAGWMVFKTQRRLRAARDRTTLWEDRITAELAAQGMEDPDAIEAALASDEEVARLRGLVDAREEQREDWLAVVAFTLLVSGVDAFVSTHLKDFPEPLTVEGDPVTGAVEVAVRVPLPFGG